MLGNLGIFTNALVVQFTKVLSDPLTTTILKCECVTECWVCLFFIFAIFPISAQEQLHFSISCITIPWAF